MRQQYYLLVFRVKKHIQDESFLHREECLAEDYEAKEDQNDQNVQEYNHWNEPKVILGEFHFVKLRIERKYCNYYCNDD